MNSSMSERLGNTMRDLETRVTQKGQVTIPLAVRRAMGLKPRDRVRFEVDGDTVRLSRAASQILAGFGSVSPQARPEDFRAIREEVEQAIGEDVNAETRQQP